MADLGRCVTQLVNGPFWRGSDSWVDFELERGQLEEDPKDSDWSFSQGCFASQQRVKAHLARLLNH